MQSNRVRVPSARIGATILIAEVLAAARSTPSTTAHFGASREADDDGEPVPCGARQNSPAPCCRAQPASAPASCWRYPATPSRRIRSQQSTFRSARPTSCVTRMPTATCREHVVDQPSARVGRRAAKPLCRIRGQTSSGIRRPSSNTAVSSRCAPRASTYRRTVGTAGLSLRSISDTEGCVTR